MRLNQTLTNWTNLGEFKWFLLTRFCLTLALQIQAVIVGWQIYQYTHSPLSLGLIGLAEAIPALSIALYAGYVADVSSKRKVLVRAMLVLLFCSIGLMVVTAPFFYQTFATQKVIWCMYAFIFLSGLARGFYAPAGFSFIAQLVKKDKLLQSSTLNSSVWQIASIIGPAAGGLIYAAWGITFGFVFVIGFTMLALFCILNIQTKPIQNTKGTESILTNLKQGIGFVFNHKVILGALSLDLFAVLFGGAVALLPVFASEILFVGATGLGILRAAPSVGASITMLWISATKPFNQPGKWLLWCVAAFGLCMIGFGLSTSFYLSVILLLFSGAFDSVSVVIRGNILQMNTPDEMRGRVSAVNTMFIGSSNEIGAFESGLAAKLIGTVPSVVFGGCVTLLVVAITKYKVPQLKTLKLS